MVHQEDLHLRKTQSLWHSSIDRIGKDISGSGMDTDVIGRDITGYLLSLHPDGSITPRVARIFVRDLTPASNGNGIGIGLADFTTARLLKALNLQYTYMNSLTSLGLLPTKIPIYFDNDREGIESALASLAVSDRGDLRVVLIAGQPETRALPGLRTLPASPQRPGRSAIGRQSPGSGFRSRRNPLPL
jgi:hypothetical protein